MANRKAWFLRGLRDGVPIGLGYFAVAFALGITALANGISPLQGGTMSILNLTSAGQAAAVTMLGLGTTYAELAFTQLVINLRYLLTVIVSITEIRYDAAEKCCCKKHYDGN